VPVGGGLDTQAPDAPLADKLRLAREVVFGLIAAEAVELWRIDWPRSPAVGGRAVVRPREDGSVDPGSDVRGGITADSACVACAAGSLRQ
jgi:hypothetical protein